MVLPPLPEPAGDCQSSFGASCACDTGSDVGGGLWQLIAPAAAAGGVELLHVPSAVPPPQPVLPPVHAGAVQAAGAVQVPGQAAAAPERVAKASEQGAEVMEGLASTPSPSVPPVPPAPPPPPSSHNHNGPKGPAGPQQAARPNEGRPAPTQQLGYTLGDYDYIAMYIGIALGLLYYAFLGWLIYTLGSWGHEFMRKTEQLHSNHRFQVACAACCSSNSTAPPGGARFCPVVTPRPSSPPIWPPTAAESQSVARDDLRLAHFYRCPCPAAAAPSSPLNTDTHNGSFAGGQLPSGTADGSPGASSPAATVPGTPSSPPHWQQPAWSAGHPTSWGSDLPRPSSLPTSSTSNTSTCPMMMLRSAQPTQSTSSPLPSAAPASRAPAASTPVNLTAKAALSTPLAASHLGVRLPPHQRGGPPRPRQGRSAARSVQMLALMAAAPAPPTATALAMSLGQATPNHHPLPLPLRHPLSGLWSKIPSSERGPAGEAQPWVPAISLSDHQTAQQQRNNRHTSSSVSQQPSAVLALPSSRSAALALPTVGGASPFAFATSAAAAASVAASAAGPTTLAHWGSSGLAAAGALATAARSAAALLGGGGGLTLIASARASIGRGVAATSSGGGGGLLILAKRQASKAATAAWAATVKGMDAGASAASAGAEAVDKVVAAAAASLPLWRNSSNAAVRKCAAAAVSASVDAAAAVTTVLPDINTTWGSIRFTAKHATDAAIRAADTAIRVSAIVAVTAVHAADTAIRAAGPQAHLTLSAVKAAAIPWWMNVSSTVHTSANGVGTSLLRATKSVGNISAFLLAGASLLKDHATPAVSKAAWGNASASLLSGAALLKDHAKTAVARAVWRNVSAAALTLASAVSLPTRAAWGNASVAAMSLAMAVSPPTKAEVWGNLSASLKVIQASLERIQTHMELYQAQTATLAALFTSRAALSRSAAAVASWGNGSLNSADSVTDKAWRGAPSLLSRAAAESWVDGSVYNSSTSPDIARHMETSEATEGVPPPPPHPASCIQPPPPSCPWSNNATVLEALARRYPWLSATPQPQLHDDDSSSAESAASAPAAARQYKQPRYDFGTASATFPMAGGRGSRRQRRPSRQHGPYRPPRYKYRSGRSKLKRAA